MGGRGEERGPRGMGTGGGIGKGGTVSFGSEADQ